MEPSILGGMDFNLDTDFKEIPLIPEGTYTGVVSKVEYDQEKVAIAWEFTLTNNGGLLPDSQVPIDGQKVFLRNWLPKPGDDNVPTASGKGNKRDSKIYSLGIFAKSMKIDMGTKEKIAAGISSGEWINKMVRLTVTHREYEGKVYTDVKKASAI